MTCWDLVDQHGRSGEYLVAIGRGFQFAHELGQQCSPVHLLVGLAECADAAAIGLVADEGPPVREVVETDADRFRRSAGYLQAQAQGGAERLARVRRQPVGPAHLLIALIDQASAEVLQALRLAGTGPARARLAALGAIGAPLDLPPVELPALVPAGTMDRPPLPLASLDQRAWAALCWRQARLPIARVRRRSDWWSLSHLEHRAAH